jgi:hypothetical protein
MAKEMVDKEERDESGFPISKESVYELLGEDELVIEDESKKEYLVNYKGVFTMEKANLILVASPPNVAKTWFSLELASKIASGRLAFGRFITTSSAVLYIDLENGRNEIARRYWRLTDKKSGNFYHITNSEMKLDGKSVRLDMTIDYASNGLAKIIEHLVDKYKIGLIVIDPLIFLSQGNENDTGEMRDLFKILKGICDDKNVAILVNHHINKGKYEDTMQNVRGSTVITGACDTIYMLTRHDSSDEKKQIVVVENVKQRTSQRLPAFVLSITDTYDGKATRVAYEGLYQGYKTNKIGRCRADILYIIGTSLKNKQNYAKTEEILSALEGDKYSRSLIEKAISELKNDGEITEYNGEKGHLTLLPHVRSKP